MQPTSRDTLNRAWWSATTPAERCRRFMGVITTIYRAQQPSRDNMRDAMRLYGMQPVAGLTPRTYKARATNRNAQLSLNVIKSVADSYVAMVTEDAPKVTFITSGADWSTQQKAQQLETYVDGVMEEADLRQMADVLALDSAMFEPGAWVKIYVDDKKKKLCIDRTFPWSLGWDEEQAIYGCPPELYEWKSVDRKWLQKKFPEKADLLETADSTWIDDGVGRRDSQRATTVWICEGWHLGDDGMYYMACGDVELVSKPYKRDKFPFESLHRLKPRMGMSSPSLVDELRGIQREINVMLRRFQRVFQIMGAPHWLVPHGAGINTSEIDDVIGSMIKHNPGMAPTAVSGTPIPGDYYQHLWQLYGKAFETIGVPQTFAEGQKPQDLSSGKAMETYADIASKRFEPCYRNYQHFYLRVARQIIDLARETPSLRVKAPSKGFFQTVKAGDIMLDEEKFVLKLSPTNALADDPAERIAQVQTLANAGWISPDKAMRLIDFPDLKSFSDSANASYNLVMDQAMDMLNHGKFAPPEPFMNLQEAIGVMTAQYLEAKRQGANPKNLKLLLRWLRAAADQAKLATPPPTPPPVTNQTLLPGGASVLPPATPPAPPQAA
jgi:hypothetical protein